ncbi:hypothetical protein AB0L82_36055 [Nocardia sp. NPDC052001]|uniref:hypothetical protein n=1 Tax=Nocardia sp. NPDC052001 TaxID=3154853 RepID=UPI003439DCDA
MDTDSGGPVEPGREVDRMLERIDDAQTDPTPAPDDDAGESEPARAARHYSTGKLTIAQARVVDGWRRQLTVPDRRFSTPNNRPPASSSDCVAAAVVHLLDHAEPEPRELIRYAARMRENLALERGRAFPAASVVSFYLPAPYALRLDAMLTAAQDHHAELLDQARDRVHTELPGRENATARGLRMMSAVAELGIPHKAYILPAGTLARLAIDRWARKSPATVVAAAVAHGSAHHEQMHRARHDMGVGDAHR